jgi:translation initiation factor RLI1
VKQFEIHDPLFLPHCGCELQVNLNSGEALVLVGENGIGKSTLLNRLANELTVDQRVVVEQKTSEYFYDRKVGTLKALFLQEKFPQFDQQSFESLWTGLGLNLKEDRLLSQLSGGEAQALKLCLSLSKDTEFYLLDEPSQFLDKQRKQTLMRFLEGLLKKNKSLLIIEHNREWIPTSWRVQTLAIDDNLLKLRD